MKSTLHGNCACSFVAFRRGQVDFFHLDLDACNEKNQVWTMHTKLDMTQVLTLTSIYTETHMLSSGRP